MPRIRTTGLGLDQLEVNFERDVPGKHLAALRQLCLPVQTVFAAIEPRLEIDADYVRAAEVRAGGEGAAGRDCSGHAPDRQIAVDLGASILAEPDLRGAELDRWGLCGIEEVPRQEVALEIGDRS